MSLSWWNLNATGGEFVDVEAPKTTLLDGENRSSSPSIPGSPSIMFLKAPIVVARIPGEKTGLLPTQQGRPRQRPESQASKQIKRCLLVVVVVMSVVTAAVIILYLAGDSRRGDKRR
ncbi:unnamed protein product [Pylaiella littoralis]